jgi:hypothetical protein
MKKRLIILLILCLCGIAWAATAVVPENLWSQRVNPGQLHTAQLGWVVFGSDDSDDNPTTLVATTTPGVTARTAATFAVSDTNNITHRIDPRWNRALLRVESTTDGDDTVFDLFGADGEGGTVSDFNRWATVTWVTGTQTGATSGSEWADTASITNDSGARTLVVAYSPGGNYIAEVEIKDFRGAHTLGISPTTVDNDARVMIKGY